MRVFYLGGYRRKRANDLTLPLPRSDPVPAGWLTSQPGLADWLKVQLFWSQSRSSRLYPAFQRELEQLLSCGSEHFALALRRALRSPAVPASQRATRRFSPLLNRVGNFKRGKTELESNICSGVVQYRGLSKRCLCWCPELAFRRAPIKGCSEAV